MLSSVLSLKPQNTTTSLLFSKNSTGSKYLNEVNTKQYHSPITHFNPLSCSTRSTSALALLRPSVTSSLKFADRSILAIAVPPLWNRLPPALRKLSDPSYELTRRPEPHPLLSRHNSFIPNLKHCSSTNPFLICPLLPPSLPVSTLNTIPHSRLTVCLPA